MTNEGIPAEASQSLAMAPSSEGAEQELYFPP